MIRTARSFLVRVAGLFRRQQIDAELTEEIESHIQLHVDDNVRRGLHPDEARRQAILALGGIEQAKERYRDRAGLPAVETLVRDVRFGARMLRRQPIFTAVAVLTLAIGFGPPIAIFTITNQVVLRPIAGVRAASEIGSFMSGTPRPGGALTVGRVSYVNLRDVERQLRTVTIGGVQGTAAAIGAIGQVPRELRGAFVSAGYFPVLGVRMQAGRPITAADDDPAHPALVAVISDGLWSSLFQRDAGAIGRTVSVNGYPVTVIGIAERGFQGHQRFGQESFWIPGVAESVLRDLTQRDPSDRASGGYYQFVARLTPGSTWPQVEAELESLRAWLLAEYPAENEKFQTVRFRFAGTLDVLGRDRLLLLATLMLAASALVLVVASSNVASLVLMRGAARRAESAVRLALGAGRWRLLRQHITEVLLLWGLGAAGGSLLVWVMLKAGLATVLTRLNVPELTVPFDATAILFAALLALMVGLAFSVVPAWKAARIDARSVVHDAGPGVTRRFGIGSILTAGQLAASLALLVGALMLAVSLRHLSAVDLGFDPEGLSVASLRAQGSLSPVAARAYHAQFAEQLRSRPGVLDIALADRAPFSGPRSFTRVRSVESRPFAQTEVTQVLSPNYFSLLRVRMVHGRAFTDAEIRGAAGSPTVVISESLAHQLFGRADVVGQTVELPVYQQAPRVARIIGVAADVRFSDLDEGAQPTLYDPASGTNSHRAFLIVRTDRSASLRNELGDVAASLNTAAPADVRTIEQGLAAVRGERDLLTWLMALLAVLATGVAAVGVYGVVAFAAQARRVEFGIRMALGANARRIGTQVLRGALLLALPALVVGGAGGFALTQLLRAWLVGVSPWDPGIWGTSAIILLAVVAVSATIPARRAARANLREALTSV